MLRWFCVQRAAWAALSRLSDGLEADAAKLNINEAKDVFAEWFQNIKAQVLPRICPADTASEWMFQDFKMFNDFVPESKENYIRSKCECRHTIDCLSATEARCLHKKCTACESDEHCEHLENTKRCDNGKCVATSSSVTTTPPPRCWDNDAGLTNEWSTWSFSPDYFCSNDITYCDTHSDVMKKFCPKFCGYCGPPRQLFALSYGDISEIFHHIDNRTNTRVSNDTWAAAGWVSNLVLTGVETRNIIFPTAKKWLRARSSQSEHKSRLSINITDIKVDADTNMTVTYGIVSKPTMSTLSMTISNVEIYLPLPSLEIHSNNRLLLTLQSDGDHVCRASHESLPTVEGAEGSSWAVSQFMNYLLEDGVKRDMRRLIVQTLEDSCSYGRTIYKSAFEVAKNMLNTWQDITSVPFGNRDWSVSTSDFVSQARGLSGIFTDKHSPFSFKKLLSTVNKDTLIQLVQTSISDWSESKNESVSRAHTSPETSVVTPFVRNLRRLLSTEVEPPVTLPQSGPEITIAYPFGHEKIPLGADFLAGFGSANAMLVEVQLHGLSSLEDIAITLEDNNYSTASVQLFGTFGMNIIVELEFRLNEMDEGDVTFSALETVKRKYQVSVSGVVNPSFGVDFGVVANLHDLDSALKAAFSPASLFKAFWDMDPKMDAGDQIHETLVRVKSCIARHLITGSGITGIKIAKVNFDASAIERVHVISVDAECKSFEELKLFDQIICGVMDAADIIYAALFNDHHVLPRLVDTVLREPAVMDAVNTYLSTYLSESIASAENQAECPAPDEPPEVPPESVSDSNTTGALRQLLGTFKFNPLSFLPQDTDRGDNGKTVLRLKPYNVPDTGASGQLSVSPTVEAAAMVVFNMTLRGDGEAYVRVSVLRDSTVLKIEVQNVMAHIRAYNVSVHADLDGSLVSTSTRFSVSTPEVGMDVMVNSVVVTLGPSSTISREAADIQLHNIFLSSNDSGAAVTDDTFLFDHLDKSQYVKEAIASAFNLVYDRLLSPSAAGARRSLSSLSPPTNPPASTGLRLSDVFAVLITLHDTFRELFTELSLDAWRRATAMVKAQFQVTEPVRLDTLFGVDVVAPELQVSNITFEENVTDIRFSRASSAEDVVRVELVGTVKMTLTLTLRASSAEGQESDGTQSDTLALEVTNGGFELAGSINEKMDLSSVLEALWTAIVEENVPCISNLSSNGDFITVSHVDVFGASVTASHESSHAIFDFAAKDGLSLQALLHSIDSSFNVSRVPPMLTRLNSLLNAMLIEHPSPTTCTPRHVPITIDAWSNNDKQPALRWSNVSLVQFADEVFTHIVGPPHATWDEWNLNNVARYPYKTKHWFQIPLSAEYGPFDFLGCHWQMDMAPLILYSWDRPGYYTMKGAHTFRVNATDIDSAVRVLAPRLQARNSEWIVNGTGVVSTDFPVAEGDRLVQIRTTANPSQQITASDEESVKNACTTLGTGTYELIFATPWPTLRMWDTHGLQMNATIEEVQINHVDSATNVEAPLVHMEEDVFLTKHNVSSWYAYAGKASLGENRRAIEMTGVLPDAMWVRVRVPSTTSLVVIQNSHFTDANGVYMPATHDRSDVWHNYRKWEYNSTSQRLQGMYEYKEVSEPVIAQLERSKLMPTAVTLAATPSSTRSFRVHLDDRTAFVYRSTSDSSNNMACITITVRGAVHGAPDCSIAYEGAEFRLVNNRSQVEVRAVPAENSSTLLSISTAHTPHVEITSAHTAVELVAPGYKGAWESLSATDTMLGAVMAFDKLEPRIKVNLSLREDPRAASRNFSMELSAQLSNVTADIRVVVQALQSATKFTPEQLLSLPCLLSNMGNLTRVQSLAFTALWRNLTLRIDERTTEIDTTKFTQQMCDAVGRFVVSKFILPTVNARIAHDLNSTANTCSALPWQAPQPLASDIFKWIAVVLLCIGCTLFVGGCCLRWSTRHHRAGKEAAVDNAVPESSSMLCSLHAHCALPAYAKMTLPVFLIATACVLMSSYIRGGAIVQFRMQTKDGFGPRITASILDFFTFTMMGTVTDMWKATAYPISFLVFVCSTVLPMGKLMALGACWYVTPRDVQWVTRRRQIISLLNLYSKWALLDFFVAVIFVASMRQRIVLPPTSAHSADRVSPDVDDAHRVSAHINYAAETAYGFYAFFTGLVLSQIVSHVVLSYHDQAARADATTHTHDAPDTPRHGVYVIGDDSEQSPPAEFPASTPRPAAASHAIAIMYHASVRARHEKLRDVSPVDANACATTWVARCVARGVRAREVYARVESGVLFALLVVSCALVLLGVFIEVVVFQVHGLAGWMTTGMEVHEDTLRAKSHVSHMSIWDIASAQVANSEHEKTFVMYMNMAIILLLTLIGPLLCLLSWTLLWSVPMGVRTHRAWYAVARVLEVINNFDVFMFTLIAATAQFDLMTRQIIGDRCDLINPFIAQMFGNVLPTAECLTATVTFSPGIYGNACTAILVSGVVYRARVLTARMIATGERDALHDKAPSENDMAKAKACDEFWSYEAGETARDV